MYTTAGCNPPSYSAGELLQLVGQERVFAHLGFPTQHVGSGKRFTSPFREDKHADCCFTVSEQGHIRYQDYARGISLDWLDAVMQLQNLSYPQALDWVRDTFLANLPAAPSSGLLPEGALPAPPLPSRKVIQVKRRNFTKEDLAWWQQFNVGKQELALGRVSAVSDYWLDGRHFKAPAKAYAYEEEDGFKLYFPENEHRRRFLSTTKVLSCYELLPQRGELLFITSSKKDCLTLRSFGYEAVAPQGEGMDLPAQLLWELKQRFTHVVLFYDNDTAGLTLAAEKQAKWQVTAHVHTPLPGPKDPSDFCKTHGPAATAALLTTLTHAYHQGPL